MTKFAINNTRLTYMFVILVLLGGLGVYLRMPRSEDPGFIVRIAQVVTFFPGGSPERVENLITDKLEKTIQEIPEIDFVKSESRSGVSIIEVHIDERKTNMRPVWDNLRRKVQKGSDQLPEGVIGPFVNDEYGDVFGTLLTVRGDGYSYAELKAVADQVRDEILYLPEVAKVEIRGVQDKRIFVQYDEAELAQIGLSAAALKSLLEATNIIIPGGHVSNEYERLVVEPSGNFEAVEDLRNTVVPLPGARDVVYLKDVARIEEGYIDPPHAKARYKADPALVLGISMKDGGNIIHLGDQVSSLVDRLHTVYPIGIEFDFAAFQPKIVKEIVDDFAMNLVQSVVLVMAMMLLTLGFRMGLVVASLIPTTIAITIILMAVFGIHLDQISLAALVIALGMLVDNAIVMAESISVEMKTGKGRKEAALSAAKELNIPLLTSSLTTSAAFLPIYLAQSLAGEYTRALFEVVTIALIASWFLAMTVSPLICSQFIRVKKEKRLNWLAEYLYTFYRFLLRLTLRFRAPTLVFTAVVFAVAIYSFKYVPRSFFPPSDQPVVQIGLELPPATPIEKLDLAVLDIEKFLGTQEGVIDWATFIGEGAPRFYLSYMPQAPKSEYAFIICNTTDDTSANRVQAAIQDYVDTNHIDMKTTLRRRELGPPVQSPIEVRVQGRDDEKILEIAEGVAVALHQINGVKNVSENWGRRTKKLLVNVDQPRALGAGITSQDVAISLHTHLNGFETTEYRDRDELIPVVMRSASENRESIGKLENLMVFSQRGTGEVVPLSQVAHIQTAWEPSIIHRRDRLRTVTVSSDLSSKTTTREVISKLIPYLESQKAGWPAGYRYEIGGEAERSDAANKSITDKLPIAAMVIIILLVAQFNSIRKTLIILLTIPLGLIGVVVGLLATDSYLGFVTFLGIISLAGIVVNNGIVLIDRIRIEEEGGLKGIDAIMAACTRRLRPILLTTATTIGGLIPLIFDGGPMFEPMAIAIVFGLLFSTLLTLFVIPVLYSVLFRAPMIPA